MRCSPIVPVACRRRSSRLFRIDRWSLATSFFAVEISFQRCYYRVAHGSDLSREGIVTEGSCLFESRKQFPLEELIKQD